MSLSINLGILARMNPGPGYGQTRPYSANAALSASDDGAEFNNTAAPGKIDLTAFAAAAGRSITLRRREYFPIKLIAGAGDTIKGYGASFTMVSSLIVVLVCADDGVWEVGLKSDDDGVADIYSHGGAGLGTDDSVALARMFAVAALSGVKVPAKLRKGDFGLTSGLDMTAPLSGSGYSQTNGSRLVNAGMTSGAFLTVDPNVADQLWISQQTALEKIGFNGQYSGVVQPVTFFYAPVSGGLYLQRYAFRDLSGIWGDYGLDFDGFSNRLDNVFLSGFNQACVRAGRANALLVTGGRFSPREEAASIATEGGWAFRLKGTAGEAGKSVLFIGTSIESPEVGNVANGIRFSEGHMGLWVASYIEGFAGDDATGCRAIAVGTVAKDETSALNTRVEAVSDFRMNGSHFTTYDADYGVQAESGTIELGNVFNADVSTHMNAGRILVGQYARSVSKLPRHKLDTYGAFGGHVEDRSLRVGRRPWNFLTTEIHALAGAEFTNVGDVDHDLLTTAALVKSGRRVLRVRALSGAAEASYLQIRVRADLASRFNEIINNAVTPLTGASRRNAVVAAGGWVLVAGDGAHATWDYLPRMEIRFRQDADGTPADVQAAIQNLGYSTNTKTCAIGEWSNWGMVADVTPSLLDTFDQFEIRIYPYSNHSGGAYSAPGVDHAIYIDLDTLFMSPQPGDVQALIEGQWEHPPLADCLSGSAVYDPANLADGAGVTTTVTVTGAALGDFVQGVSFSLDLQGITMTGWVSAANTVSVRFQNETGAAIDLLGGTIRAVVRPAQ